MTMQRGFAAFAALVFVAFMLPVAAQEPERPSEELDTVLVIGVQPGPGLWKISKDDHVMWVLGTPGPLPKNMKWNSRKVEARIAESQEVLYGANVNVRADIGILKGLTLLPSALKAAKNPDKQTLKDLVPPDVYANWVGLRNKYMGKDDDIEKWRPSIALGSLEGAIFKKSGLKNSSDVTDLVNKTARQHKVKIHQLPEIERKIKVPNAREIIKSVQGYDIGDVQCFIERLGLLEPAVEAQKRAANAWSRGEIDGLRAVFVDPPPPNPGCEEILIKALRNGDIPDKAGALKLFDEIRRESELATQQAHASWITAAREALARNKSTFAVLSMRGVMSPRGYLARMAELGYKVEAPQ